MQEGNDAKGKAASNPTADLEKAERGLRSEIAVPLSQQHHVLDAGTDGVHVLYVARNAVAGVHVAESRVFPSGDEHGQVLLSGCDHPTVFGIDLVILLELAATQ